jgi:hypothetical protein
MDGATTLPGGVGLQNGQRIRLLRELSLGTHTFTVTANDNVNNAGTSSVTFTIIVTPQSIKDDVRQFFEDGAIRRGLAESLLDTLNEAAEEQARGRCSHAARIYGEFIEALQDELREESRDKDKDRDRGLDPAAAAIMIADAQYLIAHCP